MSRFWHVEEIEKLIELVSVRPCIWDPDDTDYSDPSTRNEAFQAISKQMGLQTELVRSKFRNLRAQYFRIYRDPEKRINPRRWIHFDALQFLSGDGSLQHKDSRTTHLSDHEEFSYYNETESNDIIEEEILEDFIVEDSNHHISDSRTKSEGEADILGARKQAKQFGPKYKQHFKSKRKPITLFLKAKTKEKDAHAIFGEHVANELRVLKHNKALQNTLKCAILKAIYESNKALLT